VCLAAGFTVFLGFLPRLFLSVSVLVAGTGWVATENLGGILTASTADIGTGPVLILLALAFWPAASARRPVGQQLAAQPPAMAAPQQHGTS